MSFSSTHWFAISAFALLLPAVDAAAMDIVGRVEELLDADTMVVCSEQGCITVRLCGIDAPEPHERGFKTSVVGLDEIAGGKSVRCRPVEEGTVCDGRAARISGNRIIAQCFLNGTTVDIANELVAAGHACDWVQYSGGHYSENNTGEQCAK